MTDDLFQYDKLVADALRGVVHTVLSRAATHGLTGRHHFYITFRTDFPGVVIPEHLRQRHPEEMTIILQHQFWELLVSDTGFEVTLSFNRVNERLSIPFAAITAFADPSSQFLVPFQVEPAAARKAAKVEAISDTGTKSGEAAPQKQKKKDASSVSESEPSETKSDETTPKPDSGEKGNVVTLDAFRKK